MSKVEMQCDLTQWITIPGQITWLSSSSRSLNSAVTKLVSWNTKKSPTGWTLPVVEQSCADRSSCVVSDPFCLMAVPASLTTAGWSPGPRSQPATALLLICHHWTQFQSLLADWQNKRGAASLYCSWKVPPLRPGIYRSPRGILPPCHLCPNAGPPPQHWPNSSALSSAQVHRQVQGGSTWQQHTANSPYTKGMQSCMKLSPGVADQCHSKEKYKIQHFYRGPAQFLRSENRFFFFFCRSIVISAEVQLYLFWGILRGVCFFTQVTEL